MDVKGETITYLYSTGEKLMTSSSVSGDTGNFPLKMDKLSLKVNGVNSRFTTKMENCYMNQTMENGSSLIEMERKS